MNNNKMNLRAHPPNLASLLRGLYRRVAGHLDVDPSYVSRVARGERKSEVIEVALEREMRQIMEMAKNNHNGVGRFLTSHKGSNHNGAGRSSTKKTRTAKRVNMKVLQG